MENDGEWRRVQCVVHVEGVKVTKCFHPRMLTLPIRCVVSHRNPEKMFPSNVLISLEAEKNPLSLIENPHKSPFSKFFYDHSKVELFSFLCSNFYKKILSITRQRKDATAVAQLTLILNARVSYHKCHTHNKLDAFWYRFTKQVLKFIRCSVCLAN